MATGIAFRGWTATMQQLAGALAVLLIASQVPVTLAAGVQHRSTTEFATEGGFEIQLMQFQHVDSPHAKPNLTLAQRVQIAVKRSHDRTVFFHNQIYGKQSSSSFAASPVYTFPVRLTDSSGFLVKFSLGTPIRTLEGILDTGSDLVWTACSPCPTCTDPFFDPDASSTYMPLPCTSYACVNNCSSSNTCEYNEIYGNGSTTGELATETVTLTSTTGSTRAFGGFTFGCSAQQTNSFGDADGIVGMGRGRQSLMSQLSSQIADVFSYCLVDFYSAITKTSPLLLGATGGGALVYTPLINGVYPNFYYVNVVGICVDGQAVQYPAGTFDIQASGLGGMIVDSGTTITMLDPKAYTPFRTRIASLLNYPRVPDDSGNGLNLCYNLSQVDSPQFPSVVFNFENVDLALPSNNVFLQADHAGTFCLAFLSSGNSGMSIYGNVQQQNFHIAFDRAKGQIGFAPKTC